MTLTGDWWDWTRLFVMIGVQSYGFTMVMSGVYFGLVVALIATIAFAYMVLSMKIDRP